MARHGRRRRVATSAAAAAVGLCLATVTTTTHTSLAFQLHTAAPRGIVAAGGGCGHAPSVRPQRRSANSACRGLSSSPSRAIEERASSPPLEDGDDNNAGDPAAANRREGRAGGSTAARELSALLLSAMLLGNSQHAAAATQALGATDAADPTVQQQSRLIADLEKRLMSIPDSSSSSSSSNAEASPSTSSTAVDAPDAPIVAAPPVQAISVPPEPAAQASASPSPRYAGATAAASAATGDEAAAPAPTEAPTPAAMTVESVLSAFRPPPPPRPTPPAPPRRDQQPLVRMKEYSFSVRLPELNLPPVGPITVPAEGNPFDGASIGFKAPSTERVVAQPDLPGAGAVREVLRGVGEGTGVKDFADAIAAAVPKQADYNRAVMELEQRVGRTVRTAENPAFAPGVPLAPEFSNMFSRAKDTAFNGVRPYLPRGAEPELALFMLVTLPVLTVALRAADENYRRPKPPPLPPGYRPPRTVRFPNSPAKVDWEAAAEARKAREALEDIEIVKALREELAAKGSKTGAPVTVPSMMAVPSEDAAAVEVPVEAVVEAVAADPEAVVAELSRLRRELAAAGKLAAKVDALERANARLVGQVADLSRQPSPEAVRLSVEKEAMRVAAQREREEMRVAAYEDVKAKGDKLNAAREAMVSVFPSRETDVAVVQETEVEIEEEEEEEEEVVLVPPEEEAVIEEGRDEAQVTATLPKLKPPPVMEVLAPQEVDPLSAARAQLVNAFPSRGAGGASEKTTRKKPAAAKKEKATAAAAAAVVAPAEKKTPAAAPAAEKGKAAAPAATSAVKKKPAAKKTAAAAAAAAKKKKEPTAAAKKKAAAAAAAAAKAAAGDGDAATTLVKKKKKTTMPAAKKTTTATRQKKKKSDNVDDDISAGVAGGSDKDSSEDLLPTLPKKAKTAGRKKKAADSAAAAPKTQNGGSVKDLEGPEKVAASAVPAAVAETTPDDYEDLSEDLSRALRGVQGYDLDALDLEMDDLRPEDLEELRNLEREMGDFDLASLEAEFDQEDDESISQALRMAAESALAHTSGGGAGRRIRTASPVGATSSRSAGASRGASSAAAAALANAPPSLRSKKDAGGVAEGERDTGFSVAGGGAAVAEDEFEAFRRLEAEGVEEGFGSSAAWGVGRGGGPAAATSAGRGGGAGADDGDWGSLSLKAVGRKTVPALKEYLDEQGVDYPSKIKKADLVDMVVGLLAE